MFQAVWWLKLTDLYFSLGRKLRHRDTRWLAKGRGGAEFVELEQGQSGTRIQPSSSWTGLLWRYQATRVSKIWRSVSLFCFMIRRHAFIQQQILEHLFGIQYHARDKAMNKRSRISTFTGYYCLASEISLPWWIGEMVFIVRPSLHINCCHLNNT